MGLARQTYPLHRTCVRISDFTRSYTRVGNSGVSNIPVAEEPAFITRRLPARAVFVTVMWYVSLNARGQVLAGAVVFTAMHPAWREFMKGHGTIQIKAASLVRCAILKPNVLTIDIGTSQLAQATSAHTTLVEIEKYNGTVDQATGII